MIGAIWCKVLILDLAKYKKAILHTKYCNTNPSYLRRWYITNEDNITKSNAKVPNKCKVNPTNNKGTRIVF